MSCLKLLLPPLPCCDRIYSWALNQKNTFFSLKRTQMDLSQVLFKEEIFSFMQSHEKTLRVTVALLVWPYLQFSVFCVVKEQVSVFSFQNEGRALHSWGACPTCPKWVIHIRLRISFSNYVKNSSLLWVNWKKINQQQPFSHYAYFIVTKEFI